MGKGLIILDHSKIEQEARVLGLGGRGGGRLVGLESVLRNWFEAVVQRTV